MKAGSVLTVKTIPVHSLCTQWADTQLLVEWVEQMASFFEKLFSISIFLSGNQWSRTCWRRVHWSKLRDSRWVASTPVSLPPSHLGEVHSHLTGPDIWLLLDVLCWGASKNHMPRKYTSMPSQNLVSSPNLPTSFCGAQCSPFCGQAPTP